MARRKKQTKRKPPTFFNEPKIPTLYEKPEFLKYAKKIKNILQKSPNLTIRQIHEKLPCPIKEWTMDALEWIGTTQSLTLPTKFSLAPSASPITPFEYSNSFVFSPKRPF